MIEKDTIAAVATPPGMGGIGIVRVSGPKALDIGSSLFRPSRSVSLYESHRLYHGHVVERQTDTVVDEVLFSVMYGPHSFTGEDTVEINCHGGPLIVSTVLDSFLAAGARPAEPGEFTKRAFLNGRLDLSQAEAIADVITAKTRQGLEYARSQLAGALSETVHDLRAQLIDMLAELEASIDFSHEDLVGDMPTGDVQKSMTTVIDDLTALHESFRQGALFRDGLSLLIVGKPNGGKSSLMNRLAGQDRAIVTDIPGTTRDCIETGMDVGGIPVTVIDTAGIREAGDIIEEEGIRRVWKKAASADLIILLFDGSTPLSDDDRAVVKRIGNKTAVAAVNKSDLPQRTSLDEAGMLLPGVEVVAVSAKYGDGMDELKEAIRRCIFRDIGERRSDVVLTSTRHREAVARAQMLLQEARAHLADAHSPVFSAQDVREALDELGDIVGLTTSEDVLGKIFSRFCIGK